CVDFAEQSSWTAAEYRCTAGYSLYAIVIQQGLLSALGTLHSGKFCEQPKTLHSTRQSTSACMSHSVILASRALLGKSNLLLFPTRFNELLLFKSPERGINHATSKPRCIHDVEPI